MHAVIGWQPEDILEMNDEALATFRKQLQDDAVIGVGETGLDYYWDDNPSADEQKKAFIQQLTLAREFNLPVTVHTRNATADTYQTLKDAHVEEFGGVMHSFTGTPEEAKQFLDLGMYISFSGIATFKNAKDVQETLKSVPLDRLLVETDAPYLAPTPMRGKPNEPMYVHYIIDYIAELLGKSYDEVAKITTNNARRLWHLDQVK
jgi:TatD DNase family protein